MNIAIIGIGNIGGALARGWAKAGHRIYLGVRDTQSPKAKSLAAFNKNIMLYSVYDAAQAADIIVIAVQPLSLNEVCENLGDVTGKLIIDTMNSLFAKPVPYETTSIAIRNLTNNDRVVKAFNCTGWENLETPMYGEQRADMFYAGDRTEDKAIVADLIEEIGLVPHDFGGLDNEKLLEQFAMVWINLALKQGYGRNIAFKLMHREK